MADEVKPNRSPDEAKADAKAAIEAGATKVVAKRQADGTWTMTITTP